MLIMSAFKWHVQLVILDDTSEMDFIDWHLYCNFCQISGAGEVIGC